MGVWYGTWHRERAVEGHAARTAKARKLGDGRDWAWACLVGLMPACMHPLVQESRVWCVVWLPGPGHPHTKHLAEPGPAETQITSVSIGPGWDEHALWLVHERVDAAGRQSNG